MRKQEIITSNAVFAAICISLSLFTGCGKPQNSDTMSASANIIFLHHSTGRVILRGDASRVLYKLGFDGGVHKILAAYSKQKGTRYLFSEMYFPKEEVYGWNNYPYDYYNIWVKHAGNEPFMDEPTLEMLTKKHNLIVFKHCFSVSKMVEATGQADIDSDMKTLDNYKLQYEALKEKLRQFPDTRFLLWTGAALVRKETTEEQARRANDFFDWVVNEWDETGDNIYLWDFRSLETGGGLYMLDEYAASVNDSHPNRNFAGTVAPLFAQRIIDVLEDRGDTADITGK